jgi:hypothetical protein
MNYETEEGGLVLPDWKMPWVGKIAVCFILAFFITVPMCTVITGLDDAEVAAAESTAEVARIKAQAEHDKQRTTAVERFVQEHNYSPMAARCAVYGWSNSSERTACEEASEEQARKQ